MGVLRALGVYLEYLYSGNSTGYWGILGTLGDTEAWHLLPSQTMGGPPPRVPG